MSASTPEPAENLAASTVIRAVGEIVRSLRKEKGYTLSQLSELSGLSTGIVSQIERGTANPSFSTLVQLAHALGIPVGRLFNVPHQFRSPVVRRNERRRLDNHGLRPDDGSTFELLTPDLNGSLEATWVVTPPGYDTSATPFRHSGEEFGLVLSGRKDVYLDGVKHELGPGDSIRYPSTIPHWYANSGDETCTAVWVITPPTW
ncbi:cupin domain-containing protein [Streptomyces sp. NBC_00820]|uniref:helix-turn-helix domain-containing protein n=1 Tax=Streptomyces sp. NBC_00820 TaxID=2975842 RepID=UPI002ED5CB91|nr:cupin domain-containing protein [Streptomyces sp. NBC_00820]